MFDGSGSSLKFRFWCWPSPARGGFGNPAAPARCPSTVFPEFAPPKVEIQTEGPGMTSAEGGGADYDSDGGSASGVHRMAM